MRKIVAILAVLILQAVAVHYAVGNPVPAALPTTAGPLGLNISGNLTVSFIESGIPSSFPPWNINASGNNISSTNQFVNVSVSRGFHHFAFYSAGYNAFPRELEMNVSTNDSITRVEFTKLPYYTGGYIRSTLFLSNGSVVDGSPVFPGTGNGPSDITYDPSNGLLYVAEHNGSRILILNSTGFVEGSIALNSTPDRILFDPLNNELYVSESQSGNIAVINGSTDSITSIISLAPGGLSMSLDPQTDTIYAGMIRSASVYTVNATDNSVTGSFNVTVGPILQILFDPSTNLLYAACAGNSSIEVLTASGTYFGSVSLGTKLYGYSMNTPFDFVLDPLKDLILVNARDYGYPVTGTNPNPHSAVFVINGSTQNISSVITQLPFGNTHFSVYSYSMYFNPYNGLVYGASNVINRVVVFRLNGSVPEIFNTSYSYPVSGSMALDPHSRILFYPETGINAIAMITFRTLQVTFHQNTLETGTEWSVTLGGLEKASTGNTITFGVLNGTYNYTISQVKGYSLTSSRGMVSVSGIPQSVNVKFVASFPEGSVKVYEIGLPFNSNWTFSAGNLSRSAYVLFKDIWNPEAISLKQHAGTWLYTVRSAGYRVVTRQEYFNVKFSGSNYLFNDYVETYPYLSSSGNITDTGNSAYVVFFLPYYYAVNFTETGLPHGIYWGVTFNGVTKQTNGTYLYFSAENGTYSYSAATWGSFSYPVTLTGASAGYSAGNVTEGKITISGESVHYDIPFVRVTGFYFLNVTFRGFPTDAVFTSLVSGGGALEDEYSIGSYSFSPAENYSIHFLLKNGTYHLNDTAYAGPYSGFNFSIYNYDYNDSVISINGSDAYVNFTCALPHGYYEVEFNITGLPSGSKRYLSLDTGNSNLIPSFLEGRGNRFMMIFPNGTYNDAPYSSSREYSSYPLQSTVRVSVPSPSDFTVVEGTVLYLQSGGGFAKPLNDYYQNPVNFTVNGKPETVRVHYYMEYNVTFSIRGIGTSPWSVSLNGKNFSSGSDTMNITIINGTYHFHVLVPGNYLLSQSNGTFTVIGASWNFTIYARREYDVTLHSVFPDSLAGIHIRFIGKLYTITSAPLHFLLVNGTYSLEVMVPEGYSVVNGTDTLNVYGGPVNMTIVIVSTSHSAATLAGYYFNLIIASLIGVAAALIIAFRRYLPGLNKK